MNDRSTLVDLLGSLRQIALANGDKMLACLIEMAETHVREQDELGRKVPKQDGFGSGDPR